MFSRLQPLSHILRVHAFVAKTLVVQTTWNILRKDGYKLVVRLVKRGWSQGRSQGRCKRGLDRRGLGIRVTAVARATARVVSDNRVG